MPSNRKILISSVDYDLERLGTVSINLCFSTKENYMMWECQMEFLILETMSSVIFIA